jgi:hypothetical protein
MYPMLRRKNRFKGIGGADALGDAEPEGRFLDAERVYPTSIPFVHVPMLDPSGAPRKPLGGRQVRYTLSREARTGTRGSKACH